MRETTYYQINSSDIRSIGVAQAATTILAAAGTFAFSSYLDFSKDVALAEEASQPAPQFLYDVTELSFWAWIICWGAAVMAFIWQGSEWRRIKAEHGEPGYWVRIMNWWASRGTR